MSTPSEREIEEELQAIKVAKFREEQVRVVLSLSLSPFSTSLTTAAITSLHAILASSTFFLLVDSLQMLFIDASLNPLKKYSPLPI